MKILTTFFDEDVTTTVIDRNSQRNQSRPRIRRKVVVMAQVDSGTKFEDRENINQTVGFYTEMTLYRSKSKYYLQVSGVSTDSLHFPRRNKVIEFEEPNELFDMMGKENSQIYWSPLVEELIDITIASPYITDFEKNRWELSMVDGVEDDN